MFWFPVSLNIVELNLLQMAKELDAILDQPEAGHAFSCSGTDGTVSFLAEIVTPIYETMAKVCVSSATFNYVLVILYNEDVF